MKYWYTDREIRGKVREEETDSCTLLSNVRSSQEDTLFHRRRDYAEVVTTSS